MTAADYAAKAQQYDSNSADYKFWAGLAANPAAANNPDVAAQIQNNQNETALPAVFQQGADGQPSGQIAYNAPTAPGASYTTTAPGSPGIAAPKGSTLSAASVIPQTPVPAASPNSVTTQNSGGAPPLQGAASSGMPVSTGRTPLTGIDTVASTGRFGGRRPTMLGGADQPQSPSQPGSTGGPFTPLSINNPYATQTSFPAPNSPIGLPYNIPTGTPSGPNGAFPTWSSTPGGSGGGYQGGDPGYMASAEANRAVDYGNQFENQYGNEYQQALGQENAYQGQADQSYADLAATPGYTASEASAIQADPYSVMGTVQGTANRMDSAIDPSKLGISDQQVQQLKDQASQQVGLQFGAAQDQLQRQAEASGNVNPLALAAARNNLLRQQSVQSADALTNADIAATGAQRQANTNIANMRLGAATTLGGMGLTAGQYADTAASNRSANVAQQRIQGQQATRNYWQSQGQFQGGQANQSTQARLAGAQTSLSGMGQGGQLAATTEIGRRSTRPQLGFNVGPGGVTVGGNVGL